MKTVSRPFRAVLLTLAASATVGWWLRADDTLPKAPPAARYDAMAERSPFTAPTAATPVPTAAPVAAGPRWWDQMFVTSLMDRAGVYYAVVWDHASDKHYVLEINKVDPDSQLRMTSVQWRDRLDQTTVTVSKGSETAPPLRFDATASSKASPTLPGSGNAQPAFAPPRFQPGMAMPVPPPPPSMPNVVHRVAPIGATPPPNPARSSIQQPVGGPPRRIVAPNSADSGE